MLNDSKIFYWLSLSTVSCKKLNALLKIFQPMEIWEDLPKNPEMKKFLGQRHFEELIRFRDVQYIDSSINKVNDCGVMIMTRANAMYPSCLRQDEVNPPLVLYTKGDVKLLDSTCLAIVGTRGCTHYGKEVATKFATQFANNGVTVVSGLATGIDTYAHRACLDEGGKTIAVLGGGHNHIFPAINAHIAEEIVDNGLIISEYSPWFAPTKYSFPERNRIISGLSRGVVVVEADIKSGAMYTVDYAHEQGRNVYAVPGNVTSTRSKGTNYLIKNGYAELVENAEDVLQDLNISTKKCATEGLISLDFEQQMIYDLLIGGEKNFDEIVAETKLRASDVSALLTGLEILGIVRKLPNNYYGV